MRGIEWPAKYGAILRAKSTIYMYICTRECFVVECAARHVFGHVCVGAHRERVCASATRCWMRSGTVAEAMVVFGNRGKIDKCEKKITYNIH